MFGAGKVSTPIFKQRREYVCKRLGHFRIDGHYHHLFSFRPRTLYRKAGPHEALVVYGFRGTRIVKGHGTVIFPDDRKLSRAFARADVVRRRAAAGPVHTQGVAVTVEAVAQIKVKSDPESIQTAAEQFLTKTDQSAKA